MMPLPHSIVLLYLCDNCYKNNGYRPSFISGGVCECGKPFTPYSSWSNQAEKYKELRKQYLRKQKLKRILNEYNKRI
jgi:hypothetical protein